MTPWSVYSTARQFRSAFELCYGNGVPAKDGTSKPLIPGVVCLVFSIELALKAIRLSDGAPQTGHNLTTLFDGLLETSRRDVIFESGAEEASLRENLAAISNAFVEWRYVHEQLGYRSISVEFLEMLWFALDKILARRMSVARAEARARRETQQAQGTDEGDVQ